MKKVDVKKRTMYLVAADRMERLADKPEMKKTPAAREFALQLVNKYLDLAGV